MKTTTNTIISTTNTTNSTIITKWRTG
jgi:hypothetical protein